MSDRQAAPILAAMPPQRAAAISRAMLPGAAPPR
jgi:flagellar motility protein MotE (MotC chaperone)